MIVFPALICITVARIAVKSATQPPSTSHIQSFFLSLPFLSYDSASHQSFSERDESLEIDTHVICQECGFDDTSNQQMTAKVGRVLLDLLRTEVSK